MNIKFLKVFGFCFCCVIFLVSILFNIYFYRRYARLEEDDGDDNNDSDQSTICQCGVGSISTRPRNKEIVGGEDAAPGEFPWQVGLVYSEGSFPFCGGSLLSSRTVLTAAHCERDVDNFLVLVGEYDLSHPTGEYVRASAWINHPDWDSATYDNDFAIIQLDTPVMFTDTVRPICLPDVASDGDEYDSVISTVTGWGRLSYRGPQPDVLQKVREDFIK